MSDAGGTLDSKLERPSIKLIVVILLVFALRFPFLNQAIQGDDVYYLAGAEHAQIEPLHPNQLSYVFLGDVVDMRGHPHPPLNAWFLGLLLAIFGDVYEVPFHSAYALFSLISAISMWRLARRFSEQPLWATLLFVATPVFVVNGNSLESDIPFLAFWLAGVALFTCERYLAAAAALALAALGALQAVFLTPILMVYVWLNARRNWLAWLIALTPVVTLGLWQVFEWQSTGALPATVLTGHFATYGFQAWVYKFQNAAALSVHLCFLVFPAFLPAMIWLNSRRRDRDTIFLAAWVALFFAGALVVFFAGAARYLLPVAAPMALLASRLRPRWLAIGLVFQLALGIGLAIVNYQHWDGYRQFAAQLKDQLASRRVWINGEWGLRFYLEAQGGLPLKRGQAVQPGETVVSSELAYPVPFSTGGGALTGFAQRELTSSLPLRLIGLDSRSGFSTASKGFRPFDISWGPIDRVKAEIVVEKEPSLEYLPMGAAEAAQQIVSGIFQLEENRFRWMGGRAVVLLKSPTAAKPVQVVFHIPPMAPARRVSLIVDGDTVATGTYSQPGSYTLISPPLKPRRAAATVEVLLDKSFSVPGDRRQLGMVLSEVGFR